MLFGDMFDALVEKRQQWQFPSYFVTATGNDSQRNWWMHTKRAHLKNKHLEGSLNVAGHTVMKEEIPDDVKEQKPGLPKLGKLVVTGPAGDEQLCIPEAVTKQWCNHAVFGVRFQSFLDAFCEGHPDPLWSDRPRGVIS